MAEVKDNLRARLAGLIYRRAPALRRKMRRLAAMTFIAGKGHEPLDSNVWPVHAGLQAVVVHDQPDREDIQRVRLSGFKVELTDQYEIEIGARQNCFCFQLDARGPIGRPEYESLLRTALDLEHRRQVAGKVALEIAKIDWRARTKSAFSDDQRERDRLVEMEDQQLALPVFPDVLVAFDDTANLQSVTNSDGFLRRLFDLVRHRKMANAVSLELMEQASKGSLQEMATLLQAHLGDDYYHLERELNDAICFPYGRLYFVPADCRPADLKTFLLYYDMRPVLNEDLSPKAFVWELGSDINAGLQIRYPGVVADLGDLSPKPRPRRYRQDQPVNNRLFTPAAEEEPTVLPFEVPEPEILAFPEPEQAAPELALVTQESEA